jgi:hypothetical protein
LIFAEFRRMSGNSRVARFVSKKFQRGTNYNTERMVQVLNAFDSEWGEQFASAVDASKLKEQLDALYGLRNSISHGEQVSVSRPSVNDYFESHQKIIGLLKSIVLP